MYPPADSRCAGSRCPHADTENMATQPQAIGRVCLTVPTALETRRAAASRHVHATVRLAIEPLVLALGRPNLKGYCNRYGPRNACELFPAVPLAPVSRAGYTNCVERVNPARPRGDCIRWCHVVSRSVTQLQQRPDPGSRLTA